MSIKTLTMTTMLLLLTSCATEAERQAAIDERNRRDHEECRSLGFEKGSEAYGNCRLKLKEIRAQERASHYRYRPSLGVGIGYGHYHHRHRW